MFYSETFTNPDPSLYKRPATPGSDVGKLVKSILSPVTLKDPTEPVDEALPLILPDAVIWPGVARLNVPTAIVLPNILWREPLKVHPVFSTLNSAEPPSGS